MLNSLKRTQPPQTLELCPWEKPSWFLWAWLLGTHETMDDVETSQIFAVLSPETVNTRWLSGLAQTCWNNIFVRTLKNHEKPKDKQRRENLRKHSSYRINSTFVCRRTKFTFQLSRCSVVQKRLQNWTRSFVIVMNFNCNVFMSIQSKYFQPFHLHQLWQKKSRRASTSQRWQTWCVPEIYRTCYLHEKITNHWTSANG